jgi:hypothetical protein
MNKPAHFIVPDQRAFDALLPGKSLGLAAGRCEHGGRCSCAGKSAARRPTSLPKEKKAL